MGLKRRAFLRQAGVALALLGLSEIGLAIRADRYQRALAQPTRRKLALLVGINQYPEQVCDCPIGRGTALSGCLTDVDLQRELLIHRFGFQPSDILTLTDQQATREGIEAAFLHHLVEQARPEDVVVFHFSGLGSRVRLADSQEQNALVPIDGLLPTQEDAAINDLLEETLGLLLRSLPTRQVTTVLDLSYSHGDEVSGLRIRARPSTPSGQPNLAEIALQKQLLSFAKSKPVASTMERSDFPGVVLTAADLYPGAIEGQWSGFSAGLFTYALTQQLWETTPRTTLQIALSRTTTHLNQSVGLGQHPRLSGQRQSLLVPYYTPPLAPPADGVIRAIEEDGQTLQLWMAGLPSLVLEHYGTSVFAVVAPTPSTPELRVQVKSREGLVIKARPCCASEVATPLPPAIVGQLVQERVRVLPRAVGLAIALDDSLERIERVDATSALATVARVSVIATGDQPTDYVFGKANGAAQTLATSFAPDSVEESIPLPTNLSPAHNGYGLFNIGRTVVPGTVIETSEAVKTAIARLTPKLQTLLANKLLRLTSNSGSSRLGVRVTLEMVAPRDRLIAQQETSRAQPPLPEAKLAALGVGDGDLPVVPIGSRVRYRLQNDSDRPLYVIGLGLESNGNAIVLQPAVASGGVVPPGEMLVLPQRQSSSDWLINPPVGLVETHLIFSSAPFQETLVALRSAGLSNDTVYKFGAIANPLDVAHAVLQDLHQASALSNGDLSTEGYSLNVDEWATLSFIYRISEA